MSEPQGKELENAQLNFLNLSTDGHNLYIKVLYFSAKHIVTCISD
jgi:hypothetical protein